MCMLYRTWTRKGKREASDRSIDQLPLVMPNGNHRCVNVYNKNHSVIITPFLFNALARRS